MARLTSLAAATAFAICAPVLRVNAQAEADIAQDEVVLVADSLFEDERNNTIIADGNVEASYEGRILRADRVIYDRNTDKVRAIGNVVIIDPDGTERFAQEVEVNSELSDGFAVGFSVRLPNGGQAVASSAVRESNGVNALDQVVYTACEVCGPEDSPTWALRARRAVLDQNTQMISYRDAVLEVGGIPVIYLPYFAHPDPNSERRSGLLIPDAGVSSKVGVFYQQPYYWAISDSSEVTLAPKVFQDVRPLMELEYSKRFWSGTLNIHTSFTKERLFDGDGERLEDSDDSLRSHVFADGIFSITPDWSWGFGLERVSDDLYLNRYDIDGEGDLRGLYASQPKRLLSQLFLVGQSEDFYSETTLLSFQGLRERDENSLQPLVAPLMNTEKLFDFGDFGQLAIKGSAAMIARDEGIDSQRASLGADWSTQKVLPGGVLLEPFADARYDYYGLDETFSQSDGETRALASAGARLSYPFVRNGENLDVLIEPTIMGAFGVSDANPAEIPNEDTLLFEFNEVSLFESNGFNSYDLYEGDNRAAAGFKATARWRNGVEMSTIAGRRWRSTADPAFNELSNLDGTTSDWMAGASFSAGRTLKVDTGMRFDDESFELNRIDARMSTNVWRLNGQAQYFKIRDEITETQRTEEGIILTGKFEMSDRWSIVYNRARDIDRGLDSNHGLGLQYHDDCSVFEVVYQQSDNRDRELGPSESVTFRFRLKSLGALGSRDVD